MGHEVARDAWGSNHSAGAWFLSALRQATGPPRHEEARRFMLRILMLEELGLIGNCQLSALVSSEGSIVWSCMPRLVVHAALRFPAGVRRAARRQAWRPLHSQRWGNFPQAYSHVGMIHAAFAASPRWSEVG
jgi:hypothetical protein